MSSTRKQTATAGAVILANILVAIAINLLTSSWSWLVFAVLAVLATIWIGLEIWRSAPRRARGEPIAAPPPPEEFVPRPELTNQIVRSLLSSKTGKVGITTAIQGAGGFGKTTLAQEVMSRPEVQSAFKWTAFVEVGQEIRGGAALAEAINNISEKASGQRPGLTSPEIAGNKLGDLLKDIGPALLVVDDIWTSEQLRPFLNAGHGCTLLVTTRIPTLLPQGTIPITVDQMTPGQARDLLTGGLTGLPEPLGAALLEITGRWPIALRLINAALRRAARDGADVGMEAERLLTRLQQLGPKALDVTDEARRNRTVAATLESSLGVLGDRRERVIDLAIFREDTAIPLDLIIQLWRQTAGLSHEDGYRLAHELAELSLIMWDNDRTTLRLHDVVLDYLRHECGQLRELHNTFLDSVAATLEPDGGATPWWTLPASSDYLWRQLTYHLDGAGRGPELSELVTAPRWVITKLSRFGPVAVAEDLALADTAAAKELTRFLDQVGHLLVRGTPGHAVVNALVLRLPETPLLEKLRQAALAEVSDVPRLVATSALPDLPDPALNRVLPGHDTWPRGCVFMPDGKSLITADDEAFRVWNPESGRLLRTVDCSQDGYVLNANVALSPDGTVIVSGDDDGIKLWDTSTWQQQGTLGGGQGAVTCLCFLSDGRLIVAYERKTVRVWDTAAGKQIHSFGIPSEWRFCAAGPEGLVVSQDDDGIKLWHPSSGKHTMLHADSACSGLATSPDRRWAAGPSRNGLFVFDLITPTEAPRVLQHYQNLNAAVFSPDGSAVAAGDENGRIVLWATQNWQPVGQIAAHASIVEHLGFAPDGSLLVSAASNDGTMRLWDPAKVRPDHGAAVTEESSRPGLAMAFDGSWLALDKDFTAVVYNGDGTLATELKQSNIIYKLAAVGSRFLCVENGTGIFVSEAGNWQFSRLLATPPNFHVDELQTSDRLICLFERSGVVVVYDTDTWLPPTIIDIGESGPRVRDKAPTNSLITRVGRRIRRTKAPEPTGFALARNGAWIAIGIEDVIHILEPKTGAPLKTLRFDHEVDEFASTPNGSHLVAFLNDTFQYWHAASWTLEFTVEVGKETSPGTGSAWSPDGTLFATVVDDRTLCILDSKDLTCLTELRLDGEIHGCAWLDNSRLVAVGRRDVYWLAFEPGH